MSATGARRQGLMFAALLGVVVVNYGLFRVLPRVRELRTLAARRVELAAEVGQADRGLLALEAARSELDALRGRLAEDEERARDGAAAFASPAEQPDLEVRLSQLAGESGLVIEAREGAAPVRPAAAAAAAVLPGGPWALVTGATPLERPLQRWTVRGGFRALWGFLGRLRELPWRVAVIRLEVERPPGAEGPEATLAIRMTVAL